MVSTIEQTEIRSLAVRHLADLPRPSTLVVRLPGWERHVVFTTSRQRVAAHIPPVVLGEATGPLPIASDIVVTPLEYEALAAGLADGCASREAALRELRRKAADASHRITRAALLGPVRHPDGAAIGRGDCGAMTWGQIFDALGAELVAVEIEDERDGASEREKKPRPPLKLRASPSSGGSPGPRCGSASP